MMDDFQNPEGLWEHNGGFVVELTDDADVSVVPPSGASVSGKTVTVPVGRIKQMPGAIQLYAQNNPFYFGYPRIKYIRDSDGNLLWVNKNHRQEVLG